MIDHIDSHRDEGPPGGSDDVAVEHFGNEAKVLQLGEVELRELGAVCAKRCA